MRGFDCKYYLATNQDLKSKWKYISFVHYFLFGYYENRYPSLKCEDLELIKKSSLFDEKYYIETNNDISFFRISPIEHFYKKGWKEGRNPSNNFDLLKYSLKYFDIKYFDINPFVHYINWGIINSSRIIMYEKKRLNKHLVLDKYLPILLNLNFGYLDDELSIEKQTKIAVIIDLTKNSCLDNYYYYLKNIPFAYYLIIIYKTTVIDEIPDEIKGLYYLKEIKKFSISDENSKKELFEIFFTNNEKTFTYYCFLNSEFNNENSFGLFDFELHCILGSEVTVHEIIDRLEAANSSINMIAPVFCEASYNIIHSKKQFLKDLDTNFYPVGHNFWTNKEILVRAKNIYLELILAKPSIDFIDGLSVAVTLAAIKEGKDIALVRNKIPHYIKSSFGSECHYKFPLEFNAENTVREYLKKKGKSNKIAIFTAIMGSYDQLILPEVLNPKFDYYYYTDTYEPVNSYGIYNVILTDYYDSNQAKSARFIKTHPHVLLENYDIAVWIDSSILIRGDLNKYIDDTINANLPIGGISHPLRKCIYKEAYACIGSSKDASQIVKKQINIYKKEGYASNNGLVESGLLIYNLKHPKTADILNDWWNEIFEFSKRDQLSFNYVLWKHNCEMYEIFKHSISIRGSIDFGLFGHGVYSKFLSNQKDLPQKVEIPNFYKNSTKKILCKVDVIICIHNAYQDVKDCFDSISVNCEGLFNLIIVDDGSSAETRSLINNYFLGKTNFNVIIHRNTKALGYTKSANIGMKLSTSEMIILLNSDTVVTEKWIEKMRETLFKDDSYGIVGPISNAAGYQSIPSNISSKTQTVINDLPEGYSIDDMNDFCESQSEFYPYPRVGLIHGFCLGFKKDLIDKIGYFDEENFPIGYGDENDFCIRAFKKGYFGVIAIDTYIYHKKSKSFSCDDIRNELMNSGAGALKRKYGKQIISNLIVQINNNPALKKYRDSADTLYKKSK
ncbi:MAG: glycosyltransferase [bacterium]|nr:glycosyltransferase [bacterium]